MNRQATIESFHKLMIDTKVIQKTEWPITLKSGRVSNYYVNWRPVLSDAYYMDLVSECIIELVTECRIEPDAFYGVPESGTKLGLITEFKWAQRHKFTKVKSNLVMGRSVPKTHGDKEDRYFIGKPHGKIILLEDTVTTGQSILECMEVLKDHFVVPAAVISLTDRVEKRDDGKYFFEVMQDMRIPYYPMSRADEILKMMEEK